MSRKNKQIKINAQSKHQPIRRDRIEPRNDKQREYLRFLRTEEQVFATGPAGTSKTYLAACVAADNLSDGKIDRIVISRPVIGIGKTIGLLPGDVVEKLTPWLNPIIEVLQERLGKNIYQQHLRSGVIELAPFEMIRGRTFKGCTVILDEAQNTSPHELKSFLTRQGDDSQFIICGDVDQSDFKGPNGLAVAKSLIEKGHVSAALIEFSNQHIVRSKLCREWVEAFDSINV